MAEDQTQEEEILNEEVQEEPTQDEAQEQEEQLETQEEVQEEETLQEDSQVVESDDSEDVDQNLSRRAAKRAGQLKFQQLLNRQQSYAPQQAPQDNGINYRDMIDADDEVYNQLSQVSQDYGNKRYQAGIEEANRIKFETRLEVDAPRVESRYPQLDKNSDEFNPAVADTINQMYLSAVGYDRNTGSVQNPNLRYAEYADAMFELVNEAASRQTENTRRNVTKQAARTGLRPDGTAAKSLDLSKQPHEMSNEELDAYIAKQGFAPKKR